MNKNSIVNILFIFIDLSVLVGIFFLTLYTLNIDVDLKNILYIIIIIFFLLYFEKIYNIRYDFWQELKIIYKVLFLAYLISLSFISISDIDYSLSFINLYFIYLFILFPIAKRYSKRLLYYFDLFKVKVLLIGHHKQINLLKNEIKKNWYLGMVYDELNYESVIVSSKYMSTEQMSQIITNYLNHSSKLFIIPYISQINFANSTIIEYNNIRLNTIQIENKLLLKSNIFLKNTFDIILAYIILPIFIPIHLLISLIIKIDSKGTIFFKQKRVGKDGNIFICYKYRTMYKDSEHILKKYLKENPQEIDYYNKYHKYKNDPRITKVGYFLRKSSLDELPQIFNILHKEMSFVGPRPYMVEELDNIGDDKEFIFKTKPGITGLWQVSGRNELAFKERIKLDIWYIKNWSLWADFIIIIKTIKVVLLKKGAK